MTIMDVPMAIGGLAHRADNRVQREVLRSLHLFAESLGNAIDAKDHCTCLHSEEVAIIAQALHVFGSTHVWIRPKNQG